MIKLYNNNAYKWFEKENVYTIGYVFYYGKVYQNMELTNLIISLRENIVNEMQKITGYFAIVIKNNKETILISDIIRSFPLFYNKNGDITDDISILKGNIDELSLKELLQARWISCDDTIYQNTKQIENAQIVILKNKKVLKQKYFEYEYKHSDNYSFEELDKVFQNMTQKMIQYLDGRTAVIPLSGGHDSRLLLYYMKQSGYPNIITYTYGNKNGDEVKVSKKVADFLEVPWFFVEYKKDSCRKKYNNKKIFSKIADYFARGYSIPHIQEWEAIQKLINEKIIDSNSIIIPGFTLDFLTGSHLYSEHVEKEILPKSTINEKIYINNYNLTKKDNSIFDKKLEKKFNIRFEEDCIPSKQVANIYEKYDFEERQAKFITNAVRTYDYYGLKWYLPFWDKNVVEFWNKVSLKDRYKRKFFIDFVHYKYKELMEYAPIYKKKAKLKKQSLLRKIWNIFKIYNNDQLNYYYYFKYKKYLYYAIFEKNFNYDYYVAKDYVRYIRRKK